MIEYLYFLLCHITFTDYGISVFFVIIETIHKKIIQGYLGNKLLALQHELY